MTTKARKASPSPPELRLENQLCFAVYAAAHSFTRAYKSLLGPVGLTYPQYLVLLELWEQDGRTVSALAEPLFLDSGTLTPLLKRMEAAGWLTRRRDDADERVVRVNLTDKGRAFRDRARAFPLAMLCASGLDVKGLGALRDQLKEVSCGLRMIAAPEDKPAKRKR